MKKIILLLALVVVLHSTSAFAEGVSSDTPIVNTYKDATSTSISISLPSGYNGSVTTVYDGNEFKTTYSTSTVQDDSNFAKIQNDILAQEDAMNAYFQNQQKLFQQLWSDFGWN